MDENIDARMPIDKVTAKPFTDPVPSKYKNNATIKVVILESIIVLKASEKPLSIATIFFLLFFISSFILSKIRTLASTAIPIVRTIPAIPGKVKAEPINANKEITIAMLTIKAKMAITP